MNKSKLIIFSTFVVLILSMSAFGQLQSFASSIVKVDFDSTLFGVNNGVFNGSGFTPGASGAGQLDSNAFETTGFGTNVAYGATETTGDAARGNSTAGGVGTGGVYSFGSLATPNVALGVQPGGSDFTPGTITLRIQNASPITMTEVTISYNILVNNDQSRANSLNFSHSSDDVTYTPVPTLDFTSAAAFDGLGFQTVSRITRISGLSVTSGAFFYIRWTGDDVSGGGSRDEFAIDNIVVNRLAPTAALGTITGRARTTSGIGIKQAVVMLTGGSLEEPIYSTTNQFGYYQFSDIQVGESYVMQIMSGRYTFQNPSRVINLDESITDADFITVDLGGGKTNRTKSKRGGVFKKGNSTKKQ